jgi:WD40 repeat protein
LTALLALLTSAGGGEAAHARKPLATLEASPRTKFTGLAFTPDGKSLVVVTASEGPGGDWYQGRAEFHDAATLQRARKGEKLVATLAWSPSVLDAVALSPEGKLFALTGVGDDRTVGLVDVATRKRARDVRLGDRVFALAFSPDGKLFAAAGAGRNLAVWSAGDGKELSRQGKERDPFRPPPVVAKDDSRLQALAFSPGGTLLATGSAGGSVTLWSAPRLGSKTELTGHLNQVRCLAFSPDGKLLASGGDDKTVRLWDVKTGRQVVTFRGHLGGVTQLAFLPGTDLLVSAGHDGQLRVWDVRKERCNAVLARQGQEVTGLAVSPDGKRLASASLDSSLHLYSTGGLEQPEPQPRLIPAGYFCQAVAQSPDGKLIAAGHPSGETMVFDARTGELLRKFGHRARVLAFHPTDGTLATGHAQEGLVELWEARSGKRLGGLGMKRFRDGVNLLAFSPDGKALLSGHHDRAVLWDVKERKEGKKLGLGGRGYVPLSASRDGKYLVVSAGGAKVGAGPRLVVADAAESKAVLAITPPPGVALRVAALSPDGKALVAGGQQFTPAGPFRRKYGDGALLFYAVDLGGTSPTAKLVETVKEKGLEPIQSLAFSPDGKVVVTGASNRTLIRVYDPATGKEIASAEQGRSPVWGLTFSPDGKTVLAAVGGNNPLNGVLLWQLDALLLPARPPGKE